MQRRSENNASEVTPATRPPTQVEKGGSTPTPTLLWHYTDTHCLSWIRLLIDRFHYSHRSASCPMYYAGLLGSGPNSPPRLYAGVIYTMATARSWTGKAWELQRLVRHPNFRPPLTMLIGRSVRAIRRLPKAPNVLISYADAGHGHHGGIYQAANWYFHGKRKRCMDGLVVDGTFVPGRSCNSRWGTRSPSRLAVVLPDASIEAHYDDGKYLYWLPIKTDGSELALEKNPYPKPDR